MGKLFAICLISVVVFSILLDSVAADEENRPAKKLLFDALGMELHDPRKRRHYGVGKHGHHGKYGKKRRHRRRKRGSSTSGTSDSDSHSDSDGGHHKRKGKRGHGSDSDSDKHSSDEAEL